MNAALTVTDLFLTFDGVRALDDVSLRVMPGTVHAVIGPNGAGKSTLFNVISGIYRPSRGSVMLGDQELVGRRPHEICRLGVARTFQNLALFPEVSVADNMLLGRHHLTRAGFLTGGLWFPSARREEARHRVRVREIAEFVGVADLLAVSAGELSYGDRKRVELGRALCVEPRVLLLDEPVAGMNAGESRRMAQVIVDIRAALDVSMLLVEHDMNVVMGIADELTVLDFGRLLANGTPSDIRSHPDVCRAYLGHASAEESTERSAAWTSS
jgi:branched-chain amino acid transport system ATP-binding protein